jgi:hypothetical protein
MQAFFLYLIIAHPPALVKASSRGKKGQASRAACLPFGIKSF